MPLNLFKLRNKSYVAAGGGGAEPASHFARLLEESPFLRTLSHTPIAEVDREEVHTGTSDKGILVGGLFRAYAVTRICLKERHGSDANDTANAARQALADESAQQPMGYYSIKHCCRKTIKRKLDKQKWMLRCAINALVEANYLDKLQHANILELKGLGSDATDGAFFLITPRIAETLEERLVTWQAEQAKNPSSHALDPQCPSYATKMGYARDIISALQYLHERQIVVLGLTPCSIGFLAQSGRLQICDLGMAREISAFGRGEQRPNGEFASEELKFDDDDIGDGERFAPTIGGKGVADMDDLLLPLMETGVVPRYLAPELVLLGAKSASLGADVYSWAMIFLEMLTLQKVFSHYQSQQYVIKVCMEAKRPNLSLYPRLPVYMDALLRRAWRHHVDERYSSTKVKGAIQKIMGKHFGSNPQTGDTNVAPPIARLGSFITTSAKTSSIDESLMNCSIFTQSRRNTPSQASPLLPDRNDICLDESLMEQSMTEHPPKQGDESKRSRQKRNVKGWANARAASMLQVTSATNSSAGNRDTSSPQRTSHSRRRPVGRSKSDCGDLEGMARRKQVEDSNYDTGAVVEDASKKANEAPRQDMDTSVSVATPSNRTVSGKNAPNEEANQSLQQQMSHGYQKRGSSHRKGSLEGDGNHKLSDNGDRLEKLPSSRELLGSSSHQEKKRGKRSSQATRKRASNAKTSLDADRSTQEGRKRSSKPSANGPSQQLSLGGGTEDLASENMKKIDSSEDWKTPTILPQRSISLGCGAETIGTQNMTLTVSFGGLKKTAKSTGRLSKSQPGKTSIEGGPEDIESKGMKKVASSGRVKRITTSPPRMTSLGVGTEDISSKGIQQIASSGDWRTPTMLPQRSTSLGCGTEEIIAKGMAKLASSGCLKKTTKSTRRSPKPSRQTIDIVGGSEDTKSVKKVAGDLKVSAKSADLRLSRVARDGEDIDKLAVAAMKKKSQTNCTIKKQDEYPNMTMEIQNLHCYEQSQKTNRPSSRSIAFGMDERSKFQITESYSGCDDQFPRKNLSITNLTGAKKLEARSIGGGTEDTAPKSEKRVASSGDLKTTTESTEQRLRHAARVGEDIDKLAVAAMRKKSQTDWTITEQDESPRMTMEIQSLH